MFYAVYFLWGCPSIGKAEHKWVLHGTDTPFLKLSSVLSVYHVGFCVQPEVTENQKCGKMLCELFSESLIVVVKH